MAGKKGLSGRKKKNTAQLYVASKARDYTDACIATLADILDKGTETAKISAAKELLDRGWGKSTQIMEIHEGESSLERILDKFDTGDIDTTINNLRSVIAAQGPGEREAQEGTGERPSSIH